MRDDGDDFNGQRVCMPVGQEGDKAFLLPQLEKLRKIQRVGAEVSMGKHDAFRHAGGTTGVNQSGDFIRREFHSRERSGALAAVAVGYVVQTDRLAAVGVCCDFGVASFIRDDDFRIGVVDDE